MRTTEQQATRTVLMVRPAAFSSNSQTQTSNHFQTAVIDDRRVSEAALNEFDAAVAVLRSAGVEVLLLQDSPDPVKPDAIFPNNWFSTHADGTVVLYPLLAPNRRLERNADVLSVLRALGFSAGQTLDLSYLESSGQYLEGTGSLVLDRVNRIAYACRSPRTSMSVLETFASKMNFRTKSFDAFDAHGRPIYHTNVLLSIGQRFAVICLESIPAPQRGSLVASLYSTGHELIELSQAQVAMFAGNLLELATPDGFCIALSQSASASLTRHQRERLEQLSGPLVAVDLSTIERHGGGSFRCMLAEIHLPRHVDK